MAHQTKSTWRGAFVGHTTGRPARRARLEPALAGLSVTDVIDEFLEAAERGSARDRFGHSFTPEDLSELQWVLGGHVHEELGGMRLVDLSRDDVEALVYELGDAGVSRRRLRAVKRSVRALYDYAIARHLVQHNPAERVALPDDDYEDEVERPRSKKTISERAISLGLQLATAAFALLALFLILQSL